MKHERSYSLSPSPETDQSNHAASPAPHTPKKVKPESKPSSPSKKTQSSSPRKEKADGAENGTWTDEKRMLVLERVIDLGYKAVDVASLAEEASTDMFSSVNNSPVDLSSQLGLAKKQIKNQLDKGRKGTLRDKAVKSGCIANPGA